MINNDLLQSLERLESDLHDYSFETLGITDAVSLKQKFNIFKNDLNSKVINEHVITESDNSQKSEKKVTSKLLKVHRLSHDLLNRVKDLKKSGLDQEQYKTIASIELAGSIILELVSQKID